MTSGVTTMMYDNTGGFRPWHSDHQHAWNGLFSINDAMGLEGLGGMHIIKKPLVVNGKIWTDHFALVWSETGNILGTCTGKYKIIQPLDLVGGFFDPIVGRNEAIIKTCGILRKGEQFWALAQLTDKKYQINLPNGVEALPYILLIGWNNGMMAASAAHTSIIVQCQNTADSAMHLALKDDQRPVAFFAHNKNARDTIAMGHKIMDLADKRTQTLRDIYEKMGKTRIGNLDIQALLQKLLPSKREDDGKEPNARTTSEREKVLNAFDSPVNFTDKTRGTAWNLYMAVTYWLDHTRTEVKRDGEIIERDASSMSGSGADLRETAMNWFIDYMNGVAVTSMPEDDPALFMLNRLKEAGPNVVVPPFNPIGVSLNGDYDADMVAPYAD